MKPWGHLHIPKTCGEWLETGFPNGGRYQKLPQGGNRTTNRKVLDLNHAWRNASIKDFAPSQASTVRVAVDPWLYIPYQDLSPWRCFSVLRNPYDWLASYYHNTKSNHLGWANASVVHNLHSFEDFVKAYCDNETPWHVPTLHKFYTAQTFDEDGKCISEAFIYYETIVESLRELFPGIEPIGFRPSANKYRELYSDELRDIATQRFQPELKMYGYDFEGRTDDNLVFYPDSNHRYNMITNKHWRVDGD